LHKDKNSILGAKHELVNTLLIRNEKLDIIKEAIFTFSYPISSVSELENSCGIFVEGKSLGVYKQNLMNYIAHPATPALLLCNISHIHWTHALHLGENLRQTSVGDNRE